MDGTEVLTTPLTITGSIGIFGMVPNFSRALDKIGVHTDGVGTTRFAGAFDVTRPMDPAVGQVAAHSCIIDIQDTLPAFTTISGFIKIIKIKYPQNT